MHQPLEKAPPFVMKDGAPFLSMINADLLLLPDHIDGLLALATGGDLEFDDLSLVQGLEAIALDLTVMDENILTIFQGYESIALAVVEPFDCTFSHFNQLRYL